MSYYSRANFLKNRRSYYENPFSNSSKLPATTQLVPVSVDAHSTKAWPTLHFMPFFVIIIPIFIAFRHQIMRLLETITGILDSFFRLTERGTTVAAEVRAGTASFLTLSYLLFVNPQIMAVAGVSHDDAVLATALSAALACFIVGIGGNLPFACAPGLGLSAYLAFGLVTSGSMDLAMALTICWWSGILVLFVTVTGLAHLLMKLVPHPIKLAIVVGMGLLIAMIGMVSIGLIVSNPKTLVELGDVTDVELQLSCIGILLVANLLYHNVKGAILLGIAILTVVSWTISSSWPTSIFQVPEYVPKDYWRPLSIFDLSQASVTVPAIMSFLLICIFDISGVMFGLATLAGLADEETGDVPGSVWPFIASGMGTLLAGWIGSTPVIVCVECAAGVREGGRTGLTAVVVGAYFCVSVFLAPLFSAVPDAATAPVLVLVGVMMMGESAKIHWDNMNDALPAFLTIILMPLTYSITNGMIFGILASCGFYFTTGQFLKDAKMLKRKLSTSFDDNETIEQQCMLIDSPNGKIVNEYGSV
jgi:AGZA family xanthine/uracil permease-like MFS transporter